MKKILNIYMNAGASFTNYTMKPMINEGSTPLEFEPYVTPSINVNGDEIYNSNVMNYSTSEQVVGRWIDGKPIYRKTINFGTLPNASEKQVAHNISNLEYLVNCKAVAKNTTYGTQFPIPLNSVSALSGNIYIFVNSTNIFIGTGSDRSGFTQCYVTLEYTKTTD